MSFTCLWQSGCGPASNSLHSKQPLTLELLGEASAAASHPYYQLDGCQSGYQASFHTSELSVYRGDRGCLVKLRSFFLQGALYEISEQRPFTTYQPGDAAWFFSPKGLPLQVTVVKQLSSPVQVDDQVVYRLNAIEEGERLIAFGSRFGASGHAAPRGKDPPTFRLRNTQVYGVHTPTETLLVSFLLECSRQLERQDTGLACRRHRLDGIRLTVVAMESSQAPCSGKVTLGCRELMASKPGNQVLTIDSTVHGVEPGEVLGRGGIQTPNHGNPLGVPGFIAENRQWLLLLESEDAYQYFFVHWHSG